MPLRQRILQALNDDKLLDQIAGGNLAARMAAAAFRPMVAQWFATVDDATLDAYVRAFLVQGGRLAGYDVQLRPVDGPAS